MPPKKRHQRRSLKAQLLFQQQPLEGPKYHYASPQPPATRTVQVPSKPIDHSSITSWVLPQFDTTAECQFPACRKHHRHQARHSSRKSAGRFPQLPFEVARSPSSETLGIPPIPQDPRQPEKAVSRRKPLVPLLSPQSSAEASVSPLHSLPHVFIPPEIQTPASSFILPDQKENSLSTHILRTPTGKSREPGPVLVKDTPEEKYGVKVTWRRRRHLLAYLAERGKLSKSQCLVKS
ncbi:RAD9, HUS1, RAD1-interacting nuclear orphan protein 1 [Dipodomys spectabilis]|uniref:RAD9, HUS1, RAD1-interacting nuclear orphan protein 1 n=1 Tax=Dipodomys spectabilis TaxID=105255 RepID=UPI001C53C79F|nr:RAD9, HUS1, RAD1-interacting nuclear orphan protein 1 [Dipodomys spectabilis]